VAIVTGRIETFMDLVGRLESAQEAEDPQVEKLKYELPDQFRTLAASGIDSALTRLTELLANEKDRHSLFSALPGYIASQKFVQIIDGLIALRSKEESAEASTGAAEAAA